MCVCITFISQLRLDTFHVSIGNVWCWTKRFCTITHRPPVELAQTQYWLPSLSCLTSLLPSGAFWDDFLNEVFALKPLSQHLLTKFSLRQGLCLPFIKHKAQGEISIRVPIPILMRDILFLKRAIC